MDHTKISYLTYIALLIVAVSCSSSDKNQEANDSTNDSIINAQLRTMVDSTLSHSDLNLKVEQLSISTSYTNNDTIKNVTGKGSKSLCDTLCDRGYSNHVDLLRHLKFLLKNRDIQTILYLRHGFERKVLLTFQNL